MKNEDLIKRRAEFEVLVKKERQEENKRILEQEKWRITNEKKEQEKLKKEQEALEKEMLNDNDNDNTKTNSPKKRKIAYSPNKLLRLEAKKMVLEEQIKAQGKSTARYIKPIIFNYTAKRPDGVIETSSIEALSKVDVYSFLEAHGYEIYEIVAKKPNSSINISGFKLKKSKLIFYLSQLSAYLKSGIALADAVKILDEQTKNVKEKKLWRAVYYDLSMGDKLSTAMEKRKEAFPKLLINMIKTAEMTGGLIETLDDMVDYYTESENTKKQMKSAMTYPVVVSIFALFVVIFILVYVIPQFVDIYKNMDAQISGITLFVINLSEFLQSYIIYILLGVTAIVGISIYLFKNVKTFRKYVQELVMHIPVFGDIIIYNEVTIFSKTFANLINHNVFITDSMDVLSKITSNEIYKSLIYKTVKNLKKGETISSAFKDHWAFPVMAYQMLLTGEKTGRLGTMLEKVSEYYQEKHRNIITQMKSLIEPILIITLAVVVGGILLAVIIPMYGMFEGFGS